MSHAIKNKRGAEWRMWDLHIHTPVSYVWQGARLSSSGQTLQERDTILKAVVDSMETSPVSVWGIMDYWTFDGVIAIREYLKRNPAATRKLILPGIELRLEAPVDYKLNTHVIFSDRVSDAKLGTFLAQLKIGGTSGRAPNRENFIALGQSYDAAKLKIHNCRVEDRDDPDKMFLLGIQTALVSKESLREAIAGVGARNCLLVQPYDTNDGIQKLDWQKHPLQDAELMKWADIFETKNYGTIKLFLGTHPDRNLNKDFLHNLGGHPKPVVRGSDAHRISDYGNYPGGKITWLKAEPSFEGLRQVCHEPAARCHIGEKPPKLLRVEEAPTKFIKSISVIGNPTNENQKWFSEVDLPLNCGLVAVIGNKGSGKTALADIIALLGNAKSATLEFLTDKRFKKLPGVAASQHATITWMDGTQSKCTLADQLDLQKPERVRYLPQSVIETLCNDHEQGRGTFEKELRKVIFAHVDPRERGTNITLDELIRNRTATIEERLVQARVKLHATNERIIILEDALTQANLQKVENEIALKQGELNAHNLSAPSEIPKPVDAADDPESSRILSELEALQAEAVELKDAIEWQNESLDLLARKQERLERLKQRVLTLRDHFDTFRADELQEFADAGVVFDQIIQIGFNIGPMEEAANNVKQQIEEATGILRGREAGDIPALKGLSEKLTENQQTQSTLIARLEGPNKLYQQYLENHARWLATRQDIEGEIDKSGTLSYWIEYKRLIEEEFPLELDRERAERDSLVMEIFSNIEEIRLMLETLYLPVQRVAESSSAIESKIGIQFNAFLSFDDFAPKFLRFVNHGKKGTFYGVEDGTQELKQILASVDLNTPVGAASLIGKILHALQNCSRGDSIEVMDVWTQLVRDTKKIDFYDWLFGLTYVTPQYTLKLAGKEIAALSPGEKGALLLVFYLLLDKDDGPIIIDQPEQNLDNESVVEMLAGCIKAASERRQVIMVTHNPNLAVFCDADQIICASMDKVNGNHITYQSGSIEEMNINKRGVDVLEGTYEAFSNRSKKWFKPV